MTINKLIDIYRYNFEIKDICCFNDHISSEIQNIQSKFHSFRNASCGLRYDEYDIFEEIYKEFRLYFLSLVIDENYLFGNEFVLDRQKRKKVSDSKFLSSIHVISHKGMLLYFSMNNFLHDLLNRQYSIDYESYDGTLTKKGIVAHKMYAVTIKALIEVGKANDYELEAEYSLINHS